LVTPTDEDTYPVGIQERLDAAQTALSYFASEELSAGVDLKQKHSLLNASIPVVAHIDSHDKSQGVEEASGLPCMTYAPSTYKFSDYLQSSHKYPRVFRHHRFLI
jgi:hypothetical protein